VRRLIVRRLICSRAREERGAVLIAGLLLALSLLMVIGAAVDLGQAFIVRRDLVSLADEAALAGSQALDVEARHAGRLALDPSNAQASALAAIGEPVRAQATATEQSVSVRVERQFPTVLLRLVGVRTLTVAARATAEPREP
jgi:Flp pilus assembly protein TadG